MGHPQVGETGTIAPELVNPKPKNDATKETVEETLDVKPDNKPDLNRKCLVEHKKKIFRGIWESTAFNANQETVAGNQAKTDGTPWCYHSNVLPKCKVEDANKYDCGYYGIKKDE